MTTFTRRSFLGKASLGAALTLTSLSGRSHPHRYDERKMNIALVGLGRYAGYLAESLQSTHYCRLSAIVTGTPSKEAEWSRRYGIPGKNIYNYNNFDDIAKNRDVDVVYVVLPNAMHKEFAIRAARAGKHVIVEKPMAITPADCQEMIDACNKAGVQLAMGYRLHYEPFNMEIKRLGQQKVFGPVRLIEASLGYKSGNASEWRLKKALSGGGPLMNLGVYCVQCSRYVTGEEPVSVTAQFGPVTQPLLFSEVEESITWQLAFPGGAVATSSSSYNCSIDRFYAGAENGFFELSPAISYGPFRGRSSNGEMKFREIDQQGTQCDEICKVLLAGEKLPDHITGKEGMQDVKIMQAIYEAARAGTKVML